MTDEDGTEPRWPARRHAQPSEPAVPWPGGDGTVPKGAVPNDSAAPGAWPPGNRPRPADYGLRPDGDGTVPSYVRPSDAGGHLPGRHGARGNASSSYRAPDNPPVSYGTPENYGARGDNGTQPSRGGPPGGYGPDRGYAAPDGGYGPLNGVAGPASGAYGTAPGAPPPRREQPARPPRALPPGRHAGEDGGAGHPDRSQGSYQGMRRSLGPADPNGPSGGSRTGAADARDPRPPGGRVPRSPGRLDPLTDPSYARPGARPAEPRPDTSGYRDGGYSRGPAPARPDGRPGSGYPREDGYAGDGGYPRRDRYAGDGGYPRKDGYAGDGGYPRRDRYAGDSGYLGDGGYAGDMGDSRGGRNPRAGGNSRDVDDPRGAALPAGAGPARDNGYHRASVGDEGSTRDRAYPPGGRPRGDLQPDDPFQRGEFYGPNDPDEAGGSYRTGPGYPQAEPDPGAGAYRGRRRGNAPSAPDAPGPGHSRREDHAAQHAEGPPWDGADDAYDDDRFVPGLGSARHRDDDGYDDEEDDEEDDGGRRRSRKAGGGTGGPRRRRSRWIAPLVALVVILTPLVIGGVYAFHLYMSKYHPADYAGAGTGQAIVEVQSGQTATAVGQRLVALGVVASVRAFELAAEHSTDQNGLEPGFYRMHKQMKASLAFALLLRPSARIQDKITIPEGWRLSQIEAQLAAKSGIPAADYQKALASPGSLGLPSYANGNPEGYLFPATYEVQPDQTATDVLQAMVAQFNREAAAINLNTAASQAHMTPGEVITVASLVQAEGGRISDYSKIARVIANRLAAGMPLQFDSTVLYGLHEFGTTVTEQQIHSNTPYNTYLHKGLPPGPIDSPGIAAIEAALHPAPGNWLYFVAGKDGVTQFSNTLAGLGE